MEASPPPGRMEGWPVALHTVRAAVAVKPSGTAQQSVWLIVWLFEVGLGPRENDHTM